MSREKIVLDYDEEADVLYITFGDPKLAVTEEVDNISIRVNPQTNEIVGLTVIEFLARFRQRQEPIQVSVPAV